MNATLTASDTSRAFRFFANAESCEAGSQSARLRLVQQVSSPSGQVLTLVLGDGIDRELHRLADQWRRERSKTTSSPAKLAMHPAYQKIIGKGPPAITFILRELLRAPDHWFWALNMLTGEDPVPLEDQGNLIAMGAAWVKWGTRNGYL